MRALVLVISLTWMGASWWWYVCQIKDYCGATKTVAENTSSQKASDTPATPNKQAQKQESASDDIGKEAQPSVETTSKQTSKEPESDDTKVSASSTETQTEDTKPDPKDENSGQDSNEESPKTTVSEETKPESQQESTDTAVNTEQKVEEDINDALEKDASEETESQAVETANDDNDPTKIRIDRVKSEEGNDSSVQSVRIYFPYNSSTQADLTGGASLYFDELVQILEADENIELLLTGHTDSQGAANRNKTLGKRRADSVKEILVKKGIPVSRIKTASEGEGKPLWSNASKAGRDKNRRVELIGVKKAAE